MIAKDTEDRKISARSFTAAFANDAHAEADGWINDKEFPEVSREEGNAGTAGTRVTVNYKTGPWDQDVLQLFEDAGRYPDFNRGFDELLDIYNNTEIIRKSCDKNWIPLPEYNQYRSTWHRGGHRYIECVYEDLFKNYKEKQGHLLEIGIETGASLLLWYLYFSKMKIHGIDIDDKRGDDRLKQFTIEQFDTTYLSPSLKKYVENNLKKFDIIIEDGDHSWQSQVQTAINLFPTLKDDGVYLIEDIEYPAEVEHALIAELNPYIRVYDNRDVTNQKDEVIFEIKKGKTNEKDS